MEADGVELAWALRADTDYQTCGLRHIGTVQQLGIEQSNHSGLALGSSMKIRPSLALSVCPAVIAISGCASLPDLDVTYYLPQSSLAILVEQTAACRKTQEGGSDVWRTHLQTSITPTVTYSANTNEAHTVSYGALSNWFAKSDLKLEFTPDGRLKSANASQSSQLETLIESVGDLVPLVSDVPPAVASPHVCEALVSHANAVKGEEDDSPVLLTLNRIGVTNFDYDGSGQGVVTPPSGRRIEFKLVNMTEADYASLRELFGTVSATYTISRQPLVRFANAETTGETLKFTAPMIYRVVTTVADSVAEPVVRTTHVPVPQHGQTFELPIQDAPLFGSNSVEIAVNEDGSITSVKYGSDVSSGAGLDGLASLLEISKGPTSTDKAAEAKAEADLIAQRQRLAVCKLKPEDCK